MNKAICSMNGINSRGYRRLSAILSMLALTSTFSVAHADSVTWIPPVSSYLQNDVKVTVAPTFKEVPENDTDGQFEVTWDGEASTFVLEVQSLTSPIVAQRSVSTNQPTLAKTQTSGNTSGQWQTLYSGTEKQAQVTGLAEGQYKLRVMGCEQEQCTDADESETIVIVYDITPVKDRVFARSFETTEINVLQNDWDPTRPELSIYDIAASIEIFVQPNAGYVEVVGNRVFYTNERKKCTNRNDSYDWFYYKIRDINGKLSEHAEVSIRMNCQDSYYIPQWVEIPAGDSGTPYEFFEGSNGYYLRAKAQNWIGLGFLTIPVYSDDSFFKLAYSNGAWQANSTSQSAFNAANPQKVTFAITSIGSVDGNHALEIAFGGGSSIDISWPESTVGQQVAPQLTTPSGIQCSLAETSTDEFLFDGTSGLYRFYRPGTHNFVWSCTQSEPAKIYNVGSHVPVYSLTAPTGFTSEQPVATEQ